MALAAVSCTYESSGTTTSTTTIPGVEPPSTGPASLRVEDQRGEGSAIEIAEVSLPSAGWLVARADVAGTPGELLGISELLPPGTYAGVAVPFFVPVDSATGVHIAVHIDLDEDGIFTYEPPDAFIDEIAVLADGSPATGFGTVELLPPLGPGDVIFGAQTIDGSSVVVAEVILPAPGFVVLRSSDDGAPGEFLGSSDLMPAGTVTGVVLLLDPPLTETGSYFVLVYVDRDEDGSFSPAEVEPGGDEVSVRDDGSLVRASAEIIVILAQPGSVSVAEQEGGGSLVQIDEVVLPSAGFVELLIDDGGLPGSRVVSSDLIPAGTTTGVVLELPADVAEDTTFWVRLWADFDGDLALSEADLRVLDAGGEPVQESFTLLVIE